MISFEIASRKCDKMVVWGEVLLHWYQSLDLILGLNVTMPEFWAQMKSKAWNNYSFES